MRRGARAGAPGTRSLFAPEARTGVAAALGARGGRSGGVGSGGVGSGGRPRLLLVFDFDGTLAPIVRRPDAVRLPAESRRLLARAARLTGVRVALLSARPMSDLERYASIPGVLRIAQYGLEGAAAPRAALRRGIRARAGRVRALLTALVARHPGARIEDKRLTIAIHDRGMSAARRAALHRALGPVAARARTLGFEVARGRRIVDFVPSGWDKGRALLALRRRVRPATTFYFGDSQSDEPAFVALGPRDFGVRVGVTGKTSALYRVRGPRDVTRFLRTLVALRARRPRARGGSS